MAITNPRGQAGRRGGTGFRALVRRQDDAFVAFARTLTDEEWNRPSLCAGWTNRDVLAHLVLGLRLPPPRLLLAMGRRRWSFAAANDVLSREYASRSTARPRQVRRPLAAGGRRGPRRRDARAQPVHPSGLASARSRVPHH